MVYRNLFNLQYNKYSIKILFSKSELDSLDERTMLEVGSDEMAFRTPFAPWELNYFSSIENA